MPDARPERSGVVASASWDQDYRLLERELRSDEYEDLLQNLQRTERFLTQFATWADVVAFMREGTSRDPSKNRVLLPILRSHSEDQDPRWRAILLVIFWPGLKSILHKKRRWDEEEPDELWQRIFWAFHESICRIDVKRRSDHLVQRIYNTTVHRLYREYERTWIRANRELATKPEDIEAVARGVNGIDVDAIDLRVAHEREINRLREHRDAGRITEADFLLLVGTRLYGETVAEYARRVGLNYQVAKKRRQRAEAAIRRFEESTGRSWESTSPSTDFVPPLKAGGR